MLDTNRSLFLPYILADDDRLLRFLKRSWFFFHFPQFFSTHFRKRCIIWEKTPPICALVIFDSFMKSEDHMNAKAVTLSLLASNSFVYSQQFKWQLAFKHKSPFFFLNSCFEIQLTYKSKKSKSWIKETRLLSQSRHFIWFVYYWKNK